MPSSDKIKATPLAKEAAQGATALLVIDMISDWEAPGMAPLLKAAHAMAPHLAGLKARCLAAGVPTIDVNDNLGRWRSDFKSLVAAAQAKGGQAAEIATLLAPQDSDDVVLKPKHSAFFATPLACCSSTFKFTGSSSMAFRPINACWPPPRTRS